MWCVVRCVADFNFFAKSFNPYTRLEVVRIHWHISFMCYLLRLCDGRLRLKTNRFCCGIHHFAKRFCLCAMRRHVDGEIYRFSKLIIVLVVGQIRAFGKLNVT